MAGADSFASCLEDSSPIQVPPRQPCVPATQCHLPAGPEPRESGRQRQGPLDLLLGALGASSEKRLLGLFAARLTLRRHIRPQVVAVRARRIVSIPESETSQQPKSKTGKLRRDQAATITCRSLFKDDIHMHFKPHFAMLFSTNNPGNMSVIRRLAWTSP